MVSDLVVNASIANSKDFGKKKRVNRTAKLKQCKLDARREQWLSQVKKKGCKEEVGYGEGGGEGEFKAPAIEARNKATQRCKVLETHRPVGEDNHGSIHHYYDLESPGASPIGNVNHSVDCYAGGGSGVSSSSFSSGDSFSGSISEEDEQVLGDDGCLDDWEAMADALEASSNNEQEKNAIADPSPVKETGSLTEDTITESECDKSKSESLGVLARSPGTNRAWRPDDACRPQSLPNLTKQHSLPWAHSFSDMAPTSCPICCEDLDRTDSSFLPCLCGFRLCLFCHKRILEENGRCPGCRKPYGSEPIKKETGVPGCSLTVRLARSCSMFSRV